MTNEQMVELITRTATARRECVEAAKTENGTDLRQRLLLRVIAAIGSPSMCWQEREVPAEVLLKNTFDKIEATVDFWEKVSTLPDEDRKRIKAELHPLSSKSAKDILAGYGLTVKEYTEPVIG